MCKDFSGSGFGVWGLGFLRSLRDVTSEKLHVCRQPQSPLLKKRLGFIGFKVYIYIYIYHVYIYIHIYIGFRVSGSGFN